ncbi:MAG: hypothetical protein OXE82_09455 [Rhodobacter sp.]|nr:hypothetical protein [Rhodobacter sp.]
MTRAALRAALLVAALAFPAAAQDAPLVVKIESAASAPLDEGSGGPLYRVKIKGSGVAPKGGLAVRVSWILTAKGTTGGYVSPSNPVLIPEGMTESEVFIVAGRIPDDGEFFHCNKIVTMLHSINPAVYRIAPMMQGEGYHSIVYADASPRMQMQPQLCR